METTEQTPTKRLDNSRLTPEQEGAAVRMMLSLGIPAQEVADWTMESRRHREAMERAR